MGRLFFILGALILSYFSQAQVIINMDDFNKAKKAKSIISGKVLDGIMNRPIPEAEVKLLNKTDSTLVMSVFADDETYYDDYKEFDGGFTMHLDTEGGKYIIQVSCSGYETQYENVDMSDLGKGQFIKIVPIFYLHRARTLLDEVTITASKIKFYNRGDTLVYNADAFKTAEGSMLDVLIQQLPGVELRDDGTIYVNGRYVEALLLNGRYFFDGNKQLMLNNLAAYTVKNVEVYNKLGQRSELAGVDLGDGQYVMDVKLKKEYMVGTALNVEGGYGSSDRYLGRVFAMAFTPHNQYAAYFNVNNLNDSRVPGKESSWTPETMPTGVRKTIAGGFDYNLKPANNRWEIRGNVNAESAKENDGMDVMRTNYLVSGNTYDYNFNKSRNKSWSVSTKHKIYYKTPGGYGISTDPHGSYRRWDNYASDIEATFSKDYNDVTAGFISSIYEGSSTEALKHLINRNISQNKTKGHALSGGTNLWQGFKIPGTNDLVTLNLFGEYGDRHDERFNRYDINFGQDPVAAEKANRYFKNYPDFNSKIGAEASYSKILMRGMVLTLKYRFDHDYRKETSDLYRLETLETMDELFFGMLPSAIDYQTTLDRNNSYFSRRTENYHRIGVEYRLEKGNLSLRYRLPVIIADQQLDYLRGRIDTTINRRSVVFDMSNSYLTWEKGNHGLFWDWYLRSRTPDLVSMIDMTDDINPLYIKRGNSGLKNSLSFRTYLVYYYSNKAGRRFNIRADYSVVSRALSRGYIYDTTTGIRESKLYNVNGNWNVIGNVSFGTPLGKHVSLSNTLGVEHATSVDLVGENSTGLSRSKVYNNSFSDVLKLTHSIGSHKLGLDFNGRHNRYTGNRDDFPKQNTWTLKTALNALLELPANFQLSTDLTMYSRRGYTDNALNTDNFVWNARLTYKAMKGQMLVMLDGYDILHDLSNVSYTVNAQARTETYRTVLPRYFMFHVQWRFSYQPLQQGKK